MGDHGELAPAMMCRPAGYAQHERRRQQAQQDVAKGRGYTRMGQRPHRQAVRPGKRHR